MLFSCIALTNINAQSINSIGSGSLPAPKSTNPNPTGGTKIKKGTGTAGTGTIKEPSTPLGRATKNKKQATGVSNASQTQASDFADYTTTEDAIELEIATGCVGYSVSDVDRGGKIKELAKYTTVCLDGKSRTKKVSLCFPASNKLVIKYKKVDANATVQFRPSKMVCK